MTTLTPEQIQAFERDGFLIARNFFGPDEIARITADVDELQGWKDAPGKYQRYYESSLSEPGVRLLTRIEDFSPYHAGFRTLFTRGRLPEAVGELLGEQAVLFKEKINFKLPGGDGFRPHQDHQAGWGEYVDYCISVLVGIDEATIGNGCLEVVAGRHHEGMFEEWKPLSDEDMTGMEFIPCETRPGDAVFFDSFTPHRSGPNLSDRQRRLLYITYNRKSAGDHRERYYADKRRSYPQDCEREPGREYVFRV